MKIREYLTEWGYGNTPGEQGERTGIVANMKPVSLKPAIKKQVNKKIHTLTTKYSAQIPLGNIFTILKEYDIIAVDEAGEPWSGFLTGRDGDAHIDLQTSDGAKIKNSLLLIQWHKMESNNYEVVSYIT